MRRARVAVLISGRGSNMASLVKAAEADTYPATIVAVLSNRPEAAGLEYARARGITTDVIDHKAHESRAAFEAVLHERLLASGCGLICLAGFMRVLSAEFVAKWQNRILNIHPSLLPRHKGLDTHQRAIAAGDTTSGCTVHLVSADLDAGPILAQVAVPVMRDDTPDDLAARVLEAEHRLYPEALAAYLTSAEWAASAGN